MIKETEVEITCGWFYVGGEIRKTEDCDRIEQLCRDYLLKVKEDESGWVKLYIDRNDLRFWLLTYPNSEMHGGGPPNLKAVSRKDAMAI